MTRENLVPALFESKQTFHVNARVSIGTVTDAVARVARVDSVTIAVAVVVIVVAVIVVVIVQAAA